MKKQIYLQLHLIELKYNLLLFLITFLFLFITCYFFSDQLIYLYIQPLINKKILQYFIFTNILEVFYTNFFISFLTTFLILSPFLYLQIWFFFLLGFYKYENLKILYFFCLILLISIYLIFFILIKIIPISWTFFLKNTFNNQYLFDIYFEPKLNNYFTFLFSSFIYIYIIFLYPCILFLMVFFNIFQMKTLIYFRKIFYFKFIFLAAFISPPDIINQILITFPFIFFYEIYIFLYLIYRKYIKN